MSKLLAIETSAETCSVALSAGGFSREIFKHAPMRHAELLLPAIHSLLSDAGLELSALDAIAFGRGPGSFTSLRIGIGVVQGLAWGAQLPVIPVSSLAVVAQGIAKYPVEPGARICVAMDARMQEVYTGMFVLGDNGLVVADGAERVCGPEQVEPGEKGTFIAAGNGFERFEYLAQAGAEALRCQADAWPHAEAVCLLATNWLQSNEPLQPALAQPVYLRNEVADKPAS
ncbi:MAG: tRNA (adenosine(37)-N6)-threonylcarbamoyltransferase complex dimerization subunit type 1 TsaB [Gammaproteobacteria bacterium]|nr:tRNA (adenosine(37)-N6)-threonylcarbamoyltransferase complex dimerization subunit type 1 TsaB [Gammaproteobacteria bacterium]